MVLLQQIPGADIFKAQAINWQTIYSVLLWGAIILVAVILIGVVTIYWYKQRQIKKHNIWTVIVEPSLSGVTLRNVDLSMIKRKKDGTLRLKFWKERPDHEQLPPGPDQVISPSVIRSGFWRGRKEGGAEVLLDAGRVPHIIASKSRRSLVVLLYENNQYIPYSWDNKPVDPKLQILTIPDMRFLIDEETKLVKRHLMRQSQWQRLMPFLAMVGVGIMFLIAVGVIGYLYHDYNGLTKEAMAVSRETLAAAQSVTTQKVAVGGVA